MAKLNYNQCIHTRGMLQTFALKQLIRSKIESIHKCSAVTHYMIKNAIRINEYAGSGELNEYIESEMIQFFDNIIFAICIDIAAMHRAMMLNAETIEDEEWVEKHLDLSEEFDGVSMIMSQLNNIVNADYYADKKSAKAFLEDGKRYLYE